MSSETESYKQLVKDYEEALALKEEGNEYYRNKNYESALKSYSQILLHIGMNPASDVSTIFAHLSNDSNSSDTKDSNNNSVEMKETRGKINNLRLTAFNNMAMVHLKQNNYEKVIENCNHSIKCHKYDFKALLRRARSYRHLQQDIKAKNDLIFLQNNGYKYDLQIKNELALLDMKEFNSDDIVINEKEEKEKEEKERDIEKKKREEQQKNNQKKRQGKNSNNYLIYVGIAAIVLLIAIIVAAYKYS
eukprot:464391_1